MPKAQHAEKPAPLHGRQARGGHGRRSGFCADELQVRRKSDPLPFAAMIPSHRRAGFGGPAWKTKNIVLKDDRAHARDAPATMRSIMVQTLVRVQTRQEMQHSPAPHAEKLVEEQNVAAHRTVVVERDQPYRANFGKVRFSRGFCSASAPIR